MPTRGEYVSFQDVVEGNFFDRTTARKKRTSNFLGAVLPGYLETQQILNGSSRTDHNGRGSDAARLPFLHSSRQPTDH